MTRKKTIAISIAATLLLGMTLMMFIASNPFKVTDPGDPKFDPVEFKLEDYNTIQYLRAALPKLFKKGDSQEYVELMLVERGGASKMIRKEGGVRYVYDHPSIVQSFPKDRWYSIVVVYSENNEIFTLTLNNEPIIK